MHTSVEHLTQQISAFAEAYAPAPAVAENLRAVTLIPLVGPFAVGRTTLIRRVADMDAQFNPVTGETTNEPPDVDTEMLYRYYPHTPETLRHYYDQMVHGTLANIDINDGNGRIYATQPSDYEPPYAIGKFSYGTIDRLYTLPFNHVMEVGVATPQDNWLRRFRRQFPHGLDDEARGLLQEGIYSLEWQLSHADLPWVLNQDGRQAYAAQHIVKLARGEAAPQPSNRDVGVQLLRTIKGVLSHGY